MSHSIEHVPLSQLRAHPRNPKDHDLGELTRSIERFGFADAVVVDGRTGLLVSGHGRVEALRAMQAKWDPRPHEPGEKMLPAGIQLQAGEWCVPVQRGWSSKNDVEAEAAIVAFNRLVELGGWDEAKLAAMLGDLAKVDALVGTGYDGDDVDAMIGAVGTGLNVTPKSDVFQIVVDVSSEQQQRVMMERLEKEGFKCRPLIF